MSQENEVIAPRNEDNIDDDDVPRLSAETLAALQEFYTEKLKKEEAISRLEQNEDSKENIHFDENWQLSQFWYDDITIAHLVNVVKHIIPENGEVCLISCPTLYLPIKRALNPNNTVRILEFDKRFEAYGTDFIYYDYNTPLTISPDMKYSIVIADPPFLSSECLTKVSETIKSLAKDKIILCTGTIMAELAQQILHVNECKFKPCHRNNLANEFSCFANFDLDNVLSQCS